jgi:dolichol kinase
LVSLRTEWIRKGWHMASGLAATPLLLYTNLLYATIVGLAATFFVLAIELLSLFYGIRLPFWTRQLERVRRPTERFSWASIGFLLTLVVLVWVCPMPVALAAAGMLAFGDGFSSLVGRTLGQTRIAWNPSKTWEGSIAGLAAGFIGGWLLVLWYEVETGITYDGRLLLVVFLIGATMAMLAESLPWFEDNVTVPASAGLAMWATWTLLGLAPAAGPLVEWLLHGRNPLEALGLPNTA